MCGVPYCTLPKIMAEPDRYRTLPGFDTSERASVSRTGRPTAVGYRHNPLLYGSANPVPIASCFRDDTGYAAGRVALHYMPCGIEVQVRILQGLGLSHTESFAWHCTGSGRNLDED